jgi:hypothetical protein
MSVWLASARRGGRGLGRSPALRYAPAVRISLCGRCGRAIADDPAEMCFVCGAALCFPCWEERGHCAGLKHPDVDETDRNLPPETFKWRTRGES